MEMHRESRIALDPMVYAPHPLRVKDKKIDRAGAPAPKSDKDAKLAAALRANLARRKTAARQAADPSAKATDKES
jgi:hypothetical protein